MAGEPRHKAESKLMTVDIDAEDLVSDMTVPLVFKLWAPVTNHRNYTSGKKKVSKMI